MYISPPAAYKTLHIIQNEVLTMGIKHLSNRQISRKVVQLNYQI